MRGVELPRVERLLTRDPRIKGQNMGVGNAGTLDRDWARAGDRAHRQRSEGRHRSLVPHRAPS